MSPTIFLSNPLWGKGFIFILYNLGKGYATIGCFLFGVRLMRTIYAVSSGTELSSHKCFKIPIFFKIHIMSSRSVSRLFMRHLIMDQVVVQLCMYSPFVGQTGPSFGSWSWPCVLCSGPKHDKPELNRNSGLEGAMDNICGDWDSTFLVKAIFISKLLYRSLMYIVLFYKHNLIISCHSFLLFPFLVILRLHV